MLKFARGRVKIGRGEEESKSLYEKQTFWSRESGVSVVSSENPSDSTLSNVSPPLLFAFVGITRAETPFLLLSSHETKDDAEFSRRGL